MPTGIGPHEVVIGPDGRTAVVANYGEQQPGASLTVFDVETAAVVRTIDLGQLRRPHGLAWLPKFFGDQFGESAVPIGIVVDPKGAKAYVALAHADLVAVLDLKRWKLVKTMKAGKAPDGLAYTTIDTRPATPSG